MDKGYNTQGEILFSQDVILSRIDALARTIASDYENTAELTAIGVLKGSLFFMADLLRRIPLPVEVEFVHINTYQTGTAPEAPARVLFHTGLALRGRRVLVIEDIVDTGATLDCLLQRIREEEPRDVRVCVLLDKKRARRFDVPIHYVGFQIPERFVIGYGLDHAGRFRTLPYIAALGP